MSLTVKLVQSPGIIPLAESDRVGLDTLAVGASSYACSFLISFRPSHHHHHLFPDRNLRFARPFPVQVRTTQHRTQTYSRCWFLRPNRVNRLVDLEDLR
jgi:hypothetical protein